MGLFTSRVQALVVQGFAPLGLRPIHPRVFTER